MLYVLYGKDTQKLRGKLEGLVGSLLIKRPDAAYVRFDDETFTEDVLAEYIRAQGLFTDRAIIVLDSVFTTDDGKEIITNRLKDLATSENIFVLVEQTIDSKTLKKLEKVSEKVQTFETKEKEQKTKEFNVFSLTDAFGNRDKGKLWLLYQQAVRTNAVAEELHGILFWQVKTMLLVAQGETAGLKPFVVGKAKRFIQNYTEDELKNIATKLVTIYHDARRGVVGLPIALEQFILNL